MLRRFLLVLVMLLAVGALTASCGGDDDDSGNSDNPFSAGSDDKASAKNSKDNNVDVPKIKDGVLGDGSAQVQVSGDKDFKLNAKGNGVVNGGFVLLNFADTDASVMLTFQPDDRNDPGGLSVTTKDMATAGAWGADCSVSVDDGVKELKGEFSCKKLEAVSPTTTKSFTVKITGTFALPR